MDTTVPGLTDLRWIGRWIWSDIPARTLEGATPRLDRAAARGVVLLRATFDLTDVPDRAPARFTSDGRYVLFVNGTEASRGPVRGNPERLRYDSADLARHLHKGSNAVAVLVRYYGPATPWWMPATPTFGLGGGGFLFEGWLGEPLDGQPIASDASWRALRSSAWHEIEARGIGAMPAESLDARDLPPDWKLAGFDDSAWPAATELPANFVGFSGDPFPPVHPFGPLLPRPIPQLGGNSRDAKLVRVGVAKGARPIDDPIDQVTGDQDTVKKLAKLPAHALPFTVELSDDYDAGMLVLDFGEQSAGTLSLEVDAGPGVQIDAKAAEALDDRGRLAALDQHSGFRYTTRGSADTFETIDPIGLRYLGMSLRGTGSVTLRSVSVREHLFPRSEGPFFECSDETLNAIWAAGRRTVDLCSQDAYLDCPSREQRAWTGDAVVHQMVDLATNADWRLAVWNVMLGAEPRPDGMLPMAAGGDFAHADSTYIPDWALHWIHALWNIGRYLDDQATLRLLLPVAERILHWFLPFRGHDGLLTDVTGWVIIDWSAVSTRGASGALNALYGRALRDFKQLAEQVGDSGRARWAGELWVQLRKDFQRFWDADRGLYVDHMIDGELMPETSQHTNAAAVAARLTRGIDDGQLVDRITDPDNLVRASWLVPDREATLDAAGDMYGAGSAYLVNGPTRPWWDTDKHIVAAQPFFRYVVHDAAAMADRAELIPMLCRDWAALLDRSQTTLSETWFGGSHCHGWSATPTRDLMVYALGITPASPGFGRARVAPALGDLEWIRGAVPTPSGLLRVEARPQSLFIETPIDVDVVFGGIDTRVSPGTYSLAAH